jgi:hypothetical protein
VPLKTSKSDLKNMEFKKILIISGALAFFVIAGWTFLDKSEKAVFKPLRLFPRWVKYVGLIWVILSLILSIVFSIVLHNDFTFEGKNYIGVLSADFGLLLICFSRDKIEDEMTNMIRLKSFYRSVILGFTMIIFLDLLELFLGGKSVTESFSLIGIILFMYLFMFYQTKSKVRSAE